MVPVLTPSAYQAGFPQWSNEAVIEPEYTVFSLCHPSRRDHIAGEKFGHGIMRFFDVFLLLAIVYVGLVGDVARFRHAWKNATVIPGVNLWGPC